MYQLRYVKPSTWDCLHINCTGVCFLLEDPLPLKIGQDSDIIGDGIISRVLTTPLKGAKTLRPAPALDLQRDRHPVSCREVIPKFFNGRNLNDCEFAKCLPSCCVLLGCLTDLDLPVFKTPRIFVKKLQELRSRACQMMPRYL